MNLKFISFWSVALLAAVSLAGCGQSTGSSESAVDQHSNASAATQTAVDEQSGDGHSHDGWWCDEHGVPEEVCTLCSPSLVDNFKAKGDWCKDHDRPDSQCFVCHPEREAEFAAQYEAKYGKKPPKPEGSSSES